MKEEFITKEYEKTLKDEKGNILKDENGKTVKEIIPRNYRVDVGFIPQSVDEICLEFMTNYCIDKNDTEWLTKMLTDKVKLPIKTGKNKGKLKERKYTEKEIKKEFIERYFENLKAKEKEESPFDIALKKIKEAQKNK